MTSTGRLATLFTALICAVSESPAQSLPRWQVVAGDRAETQVQGLPAGVSRDIRAALLADRGSGSIGFYLANPVVERGYWAYQGGLFQRYAQPGSSGNGGPGRTGSEASHQYLEFPEFSGDAGPDGQRLIRARAGEPGNLASATFGLWRWSGSTNIEIVRGGHDGALGPGLGSGWRFDNASDVAWGRMLSGGAALIYGGVRDGNGTVAQVVSKHVPGVGNQPCLRTGAAEPQLRPGLALNDQFQVINDPTLERFASTPDGRIFAVLAISSVGGSALFELCQGTPRAIASVDVAGPTGPDVGLLEARFVNLAPPRLGSDGSVYFGGSWRVPNSQQPGLFRHTGQRNQGIAYNEVTGFFGPQWENSSWHSINGSSLSVAGRWLAFSAELANAGVGNPRGIWRLRAGERPLPLALIHDSAAIGGPEPGRRWRTFHGFAALANGQLVLHASSDPGARSDLWLLAPGQPARRWLSPGDTLTVPTTQGNQQATITGFNLSASGPGLGEGRNPENGVDGWIATDGSVLVRAFTAQHGDLLLTASVPVNRVFADGFEGF